MNSYQVMRNAQGQYTVNFLANGQVVSLVCGTEECAKLMAAYLDAMVKFVVVGGVAF